VTGITVYNNVTKEQAERPMDGVFLAIGHLPNTSLFKGQLELTKEGYIVVKGRGQETSVRGVFAAGDVEDEWYHQAIVAQGRGSAAGLDAERFLSEIGLTEEIAASFNKAQPDKEIQDAVEVQKITKAKQFKQEVLNSSMPVVVDFYTPPCASCRAMMPVFESLAASYEGKLKFVKVDADELQSIAKEYAIYSVPCVLVFKDGRLQARREGEATRKEFADFIEQVFNAQAHQVAMEGQLNTSVDQEVAFSTDSEGDEPDNALSE